MSRQIKHGQSHASLLRDVSTSAVPSSRSRLDAIVVPTARPSSSLRELISLSDRLDVPLVVLCSGPAQVDQVRERVAKTFGARALAIEVPGIYRLPGATPLTSAKGIQDLCADRSSDLSLKRNIGLRLGRMLGWKKILFVDDDISQVRPAHIERLASVLDRHPVASMISRHYPDNSVVCHARRLAGLPQDVFVSGAVLGVNLQEKALSFFPNIYNEDWFFFARHAAARRLPKVGEVRQAEYLPFYDAGRAAREEFGDLLAEGLYALFETTPGWDFKDQLRAAGRESHWQRFAEIRLAMIDDIKGRLSRAQYGTDVDYPTILQALESLRRAEKQAWTISTHACVNFIERWQEDERNWQQVLNGYSAVLSESDALAELRLTRWISCGYGTKSTSFGTDSGSEPEPDLDAPRAVSQELALAGGAEA